MSQLKIREMPQQERPREKLLAHGPDALTNPELIGILLRTGRRGRNVVEVARELLDKYKSFAALSRCTPRELEEIKGIGPAKAVELVAAFNLGKRFAEERLSQQKLDSPELIYELLGGEMRMLRTESLRVILARSFEAEAHPCLNIGDRVQVARGPFVGARGNLVRIAPGRHKLIVAVDPARSVVPLMPLKLKGAG